MMPCLCAYLFLLLAVLLAAACLVVEGAAGPVNRLLLAWLFCDFSTSEVNLFTPQVGCWGCPLVAVGVGPGLWAGPTPVVYPKVEKVAADLPPCCLVLLLGYAK